MNADASDEAIARELRSIEARRSGRRRPGSPMPPITLAVGLIVGYMLLTWLLPRAWSALLPGGLDQARGFAGWPGIMIRSAYALWLRPTASFAAIGGVSIVAVWVSGRGFWPRMGIRLLALGVIALDAGILVLTLQTAYGANARAAGLG